MNAAQMETRALRAENQMLRQKMEAMAKGFEEQDVITRFICAALSGATARIAEPAEAAAYALAAADQVVRTLEGVVDSQPESAETQPEVASV